MADDTKITPSAGTDPDGKPVKKRGRKKKIIVVSSGMDPEAGEKTGPQGAKIKVIKKKYPVPREDMTIQEYIDYQREHPEMQQELTDQIAEYITPAMQAAQQVIEEQEKWKETVKSVKSAKDVVHYDLTPIIKAVTQAFLAVAPWATTEAINKITNEFDELEPYLNEELEKLPGYEGKTFNDVINRLPFRVLSYFFEDDTEQPAHDQGEADTAEGADAQELTPQEAEELRIVRDLLRVRRAARATKKAIEEAPRAAAKRANDIEYPLDKPNLKIWNLLESDTAGQVSFNMAKSGSKQFIPAYYAINFDNLDDSLHITKRLLPFDKRVYIAISALYNAGNNIIGLPHIYYAMGYTGRPGKNDLAKINESITKMTMARIFFDNLKEAEHYKRYDRFQYDGSLLPIERGTGIVNGQLAEAAIHIFREPPLITFAKQRKQITTIDVKYLQSPVSKTNGNLLIEDYLIERISRAKRGKKHGTGRILFDTLYTHTDIPLNPRTNTEKSTKKRAKGKIDKYLQYFAQTGFIERYTTEKDGITLYW